MLGRHTGTWSITNRSKACLDPWQAVKDAICSASVLAFPDYTKPFISYVDGSKEQGFGAALHQVRTDGVERPVLFISRELKKAEQSYWLTELEAGALVWALHKLQHYLDSNDFIIYTDHAALKSAL